MKRFSPCELWTLNFELAMSEVEARVLEIGLEMKELFLLGKLDDGSVSGRPRARS